MNRRHEYRILRLDSAEGRRTQRAQSDQNVKSATSATNARLRIRWSYLALCSCLAVLQAACAGSPSRGVSLVDEGQIEEAIPVLEQELRRDYDEDAALHLGQAYELRGDRVEAARVYDELLGRNPRNAEGLFRRGVLHEREGEFQEAIYRYGHFVDVSPFSRFRSRLERRLIVLQRQQSAEWAVEATAMEEAYASIASSPSAVAVYALDDRTAPALDGIGAAIAADLHQDILLLEDFRVVERMNIDAILRELELEKAGYLDSKNAPRASRLVGAGSFLVGTVTRLGDDRLRLGLTWVDASSSFSWSAQVDGSTERFWELQKLALRDLLEQRGRELTPQEWARISKRGTRRLEAFLAYGQGLVSEQKAEYADARAAYRKALEEDSELLDARMGELRASEEISSTDDLVDAHDLPSGDDAEPSGGESGGPGPGEGEDTGDEGDLELDGLPIPGFEPGDPMNPVPGEGDTDPTDEGAVPADDGIDPTDIVDGIVDGPWLDPGDVPTPLDPDGPPPPPPDPEIPGPPGPPIR